MSTLLIVMDQTAKKKRKRHPLARRLEYIRQRSGQPDIMAFWRSVGGEETGVSYASARRYHTTREASPAYAVAVIDAYPEFRLEWLLAGREPRTWTEPGAGGSLGERFDAADRAGAKALDAHIPLVLLQGGARGALDRVLSVLAQERSLRQARGLANRYRVTTAGEIDMEWSRDLADTVGAAIAAPFAKLGIELDAVQPFYLNSYVIGAAEAIVRLLEGVSMKRLEDGE